MSGLRHRQSRQIAIETLGPRSRASVILAAAAALAWLSPGLARGQEVPTLDPDQILDYRWIYSDTDDALVFTNVGMGVQSTNFLSIPISFWMRRLPCCGNPITPETEGRTFGWRLRLTGVIGFAQFDSIANFDVKSVDLGAIFPGFELLFKTGQLSMLRPYLDVGWATTGADTTTLVYGEVGLRTEFVFPWKKWELGIEPRLSGGYAFTDIENADLSNVKISSKVDARYPLGFTIRGQTPDVGAYFEPIWYPKSIGITTSAGEEKEVHVQYELGVTFGFRYLAPMLCNLFRWMRLGVGWRFGDGTGGWHIRIGGDRIVRLPLP